MRAFSLGICVLLALTTGCAPDSAAEGDAQFARILPGSPEANAVLALVNDTQVGFEELDDDVGLDRRAASGIVRHREDDNSFDSIDELDAVSYVGDSALGKLLEYAEAHGYGGEVVDEEPTTQQQLDAAVLALVNDPIVDLSTLDHDARLDKRAATNIIEHRDGPPMDLFDDIDELDDVKYVGDKALSLLEEYAVANGYLPRTGEPTVGRPDLNSPVQYDNTWCSYADTVPYVTDVTWDDPDVQKAMSALLAGYRSTFSYSQWRVPYGLESESGTEDEEAQAKARNFIRVICGEHRDYPDMIGKKLQVIGNHTSAAGPDELTSVDTDENLFDQLSYPAYVKLVDVMATMHDHRTQNGSNDGYHWGFEEWGHGSRRVDHSVPPFTQCEMKFAFETYLVADAPTLYPSEYEASYGDYQLDSCAAEDFEYMFNFRGHVNFQPLWLESNAFIYNSRRARGAELSQEETKSYLRPFAWRYQRAREAWASYLLFPDADYDALIQASETGAGPVLYITDQDSDGDGLADYRLFDQLGCGDNGVSLSVPSQNCNMVDWSTAWYADTTTGHASAWNPSAWNQPDMGFMAAFPTFQERMGRFNQALDRHTNWGPTGYYMLDASNTGDSSPRFFGAYSPIVAASYDVSASDFFVRRNYDSTDPFEYGQAKWLFVVRFPTSSYYNEQDLANGTPMDFDKNYFNETSLSNDYYDERALDHWGYIEGEEMYAQVYLTYGDRGQVPPTTSSVPAP
jgi:DNA uptake protein ComE-like DNA-binding protein